MDRRTYLEGLGGAVSVGALAGCTGNGGETNGPGTTDGRENENDDISGEGDDTDDITEYGILSTSVTDQPNDIGDFESLVVTIEGIWVKPANDEGGDDDPNGGNQGDGDADEDGRSDAEDDSLESDETDDESADGSESSDDESAGDNGVPEDEGESDTETEVDRGTGRYYIEFEEPQDADLVQLQGDNTQLIDETELETGGYQFLQLNVAETNGTLTNGEVAPVETPGNAPLQFKHEFKIRPEERTRFIADFAPFRRGNDRYLIRPVASGTQVLYGDEEYDSENAESDEDAGSDVADGDTDDSHDSGEPDTEDDEPNNGGSGNGRPNDAAGGSIRTVRF